MIKIQIKKVLETDGEPREQIPANRYDIIMSIDNQAWQTVQMYITIDEVRIHLSRLLQTIPFAIVKMENPQIWETNYLRYLTADNEKGFIAVNITA